jgi:hypothetical protein
MSVLRVATHVEKAVVRVEGEIGIEGFLESQPCSLALFS